MTEQEKWNRVTAAEKALDDTLHPKPDPLSDFRKKLGEKIISAKMKASMSDYAMGWNEALEMIEEFVEEKTK